MPSVLEAQQKHAAVQCLPAPPLDPFSHYSDNIYRFHDCLHDEDEAFNKGNHDDGVRSRKQDENDYFNLDFHSTNRHRLQGKWVYRLSNPLYL